MSPRTWIQHAVGGVFVAGTLACVNGCTAEIRSTTGPGTVVDARISVRAGETVTVPGTSLSLRFDAVANDSRCPADALCVHMGEAVVDVTALISARATSARLRIPSPHAQGVAVGGYAVEIVQLEPYPFSQAPIDPATYTATFRISRP